MKVTSFELSKKLAEIGFKADYDYCYDKNEDKCLWNKSFEIACWEGMDLDNYYPAFDLETILETLPYHIKHNNFDYFLNLNQHFIAYCEDCGEESDLAGRVREVGDSLVDIAGRLFIRLHERGLIKF